MQQRQQQGNCVVNPYPVIKLWTQPICKPNPRLMAKQPEWLQSIAEPLILSSSSSSQPIIVPIKNTWWKIMMSLGIITPGSQNLFFPLRWHSSRTLNPGSNDQRCRQEKKVQSSQNHVDGSQLPIKFYCFTILTREGSEFWLPCIHTLRQFGGLVIVEPAAWKLDDNWWTIIIINPGVEPENRSRGLTKGFRSRASVSSMGYCRDRGWWIGMGLVS